jgi:hypothetical protein
LFASGTKPPGGATIAFNVERSMGRHQRQATAMAAETTGEALITADDKANHDVLSIY